MIITPRGFSISEIETSPFGLALAHLLNLASIQEGFNTVVGQADLIEHLQASTPQSGVIAYSEKTQAFSGQISFLADKIFSGSQRRWLGQSVGSSLTKDNALYRAFYLSEMEHDPSVKMLLTRMINSKEPIFPSLTPHLEEKAVMAVIWDRRWEQQLRKTLGESAFRHLRQVIPQTWIIGEEQYFSQGVPDGVQSAVDLASLSKSKRTLVLKPSGSSWSEGISFLHQISIAKAKARLKLATEDTQNLYIVQDFREGEKINMEYEAWGERKTKLVKVRLTPYFSSIDGKLLTIKATGCENTDYIHTTTASINSAIE